MQVTTEHIQQYNVTRDAAGVYELWQATLGQLWPLDEERMQKVLQGSEAAHFVARMNNRVVGFVATFQGFRNKEKTGYKEKIGHLALLLVDPASQRQGIGKALYQRALTYLHNNGLHTIQLGAIEPRFWCGLPANLPQARAFFTHLGWNLTEEVYDLTLDIRNFTTPQKVMLYQQEERISIATANSGNITEVLAFEAHNFPAWQDHVERVIDLGDYRDILVARDEDDHVVGVLGLYSPQSHPDRTDLIWQNILGDKAGGINVVGVAESHRGLGIGIALVARASEILKERGVEQGYIDWVGSENIDFYAKLGYKKWRTYHTGWRTL